ncbi:MAG: type II secretion system F family protein [Bryobacteraceae bacterium]
MNPIWLLIAFVGIFATAALALVLIVRPRHGGELSAEPAIPSEAAMAGDGLDWLIPIEGLSLFKDEGLSTISLWDKVLAQVDGAELLRTRIAEAGLTWTVGRLTSMMLLAAAATFAVLWRFSFVPGIVALAASIGAGLVPYGIVARKRAKRLVQLELQFPDVLDSLARSMRAGNGFAAALEVLGRETPNPLGAELRRAVDQRRLGLNWDQILNQLAERVPIVEVSIFAAAVQLQSRTGGKLHEVLEKLAETTREAGALKGEIRSISAHGRMTGLILTLLPGAIAIMLTWVNPEFLRTLWRDPTGHTLIWAAITLVITAHFVIRKMVDIRV